MITAVIQNAAARLEKYRDDLLANPIEKKRLKHELVKDLEGILGKDFAHAIFCAIDLSEENSFVATVNNTGPGSVSIQYAGRDMTATVGASATAEIKDVQVFSNWIEGNSGNISNDLKDALLAGRKEVQNAGLQPDELDLVLNHYQTLTKEALKPEPKKSILKMAMSAISAVIEIGDKVPGLAKIAAMFGL